MVWPCWVPGESAQGKVGVVVGAGEWGVSGVTAWEVVWIIIILGPRIIS